VFCVAARDGGAGLNDVHLEYIGALSAANLGYVECDAF